MKITRVTCCLFALMLSLVAFAFSTSVPRAYAAASGSTTVFRFHGLTSFAVFDSVSPDGCVDTFVVLEAQKSRTSLEADVFIGKFDFCTQTDLLEASGSTFNPDFQISTKLDSASLNATISVFDFLSGNTFNVSVSTTWTATGPLSHEIQSFHFHTKGFIDNFHLNAAFRDAGASGTVSDGTTNFTPSPSLFAQIASVKFGEVTITHS